MRLGRNGERGKRGPQKAPPERGPRPAATRRFGGDRGPGLVRAPWRAAGYCWACRPPGARVRAPLARAARAAPPGRRARMRQGKERLGGLWHAMRMRGGLAVTCHHQHWHQHDIVVLPLFERCTRAHPASGSAPPAFERFQIGAGKASPAVVSSFEERPRAARGARRARCGRQFYGNRAKMLKEPAARFGLWRAHAPATRLQGASQGSRGPALKHSPGGYRRAAERGRPSSRLSRAPPPRRGAAAGRGRGGRPSVIRGGKPMGCKTVRDARRAKALGRYCLRQKGAGLAKRRARGSKARAAGTNAACGGSWAGGVELALRARRPRAAPQWAAFGGGGGGPRAQRALTPRRPRP